MQKAKIKIKNFILKSITSIAGFIWLACALDSKSYIPTSVGVISGVWLVLFAYANSKEGGTFYVGR